MRRAGRSIIPEIKEKDRQYSGGKALKYEKEYRFLPGQSMFEYDEKAC